MLARARARTVALELPKLAPKFAFSLVGAVAHCDSVGTRVFKAILGLLGCWSGWTRSA